MATHSASLWKPRAEGEKVSLDALMGLRIQDVAGSYTDREAMLYALTVGLGRDPSNAKELPFVVEHGGLRTVPTLATVVGLTGLTQRAGLDFTKVVHAEQELVFLAPLPPAASLLSDSDISRVVDKGEGKGAYVTTRTVVRDAGTGRPYFESNSTILARGDGGIGSAGGAAPPAHEIPQRQPDAVVVFQTRADQGLWYRLNGDRNPLHTDAQAAARLGFPAPILHGLCTYGINCRAVLAAACGYEPTRLASFSVRFTQPVFIGETLTTELWLDGDVVSFRCRAAERNVVVIDRGHAKLKD
ncbi:MAG: 3-alpha,7-alpha, 12-alpha-trihydroxy-5-beta-cholest-24-enoyl-CoAhydratase [Ramlibacter sp.]|nr:3-alpha,7-alpha, 12-alpha-trihydroxy-5-beta-cholest-24-enoyl-CoAhydratase [Ramlibacter sp.]